MNRFLPRLATRLSGGKAIATPRLGTAAMMTTMFLLCFLLTGMIIKLQAMWFFGVTDGGFFELTCLFSVVWLAGYLVPGAPGGLGVREAMMVLLLSPVLGPGAAVGLGVTLRVTTMVGCGGVFSGIGCAQTPKGTDLTWLSGKGVWIRCANQTLLLRFSFSREVV